MQYYEEMFDKFGFNDGDCEPPHARILRSVYMSYLNTHAARLNSSVRLVACDRGGFHNDCLLAFVAADAVSGWSLSDMANGAKGYGLVSGDGGRHVMLGPDEAFVEAERLACEVDLDSVVSCVVSIDLDKLSVLCQPPVS